MQEQIGEERAQPPPVQRNRPAVLDDLERPENTEFDGYVRFVAPVLFGA